MLFTLRLRLCCGMVESSEILLSRFCALFRMFDRTRLARTQKLLAAEHSLPAVVILYSCIRYLPHVRS